MIAIPNMTSNGVIADDQRSESSRQSQRKRRSIRVIALGSVAMAALLWGAAFPLTALPDPIGNNAKYFVDGMRVTVMLTLVSGLMGLLLGVFTALGKVSPISFIRLVANSYIAVIRGTPLLVQILFVYFALPMLVPAFQLKDFSSACIALSLNAGAFNAEAIRAGLLAVPTGQLEAARSLGLGKSWVFIDVVFPQAFKVALPSLVNNTVSLLKDSSLAYAIGVVELTNIGNRVQAATFQPVPVLLTTAALYFTLTSIVSWIANAVEGQYDIEGKRK